jgi:hypothetical protein
VSHPDGLPDLFLDRSLGRITVPTVLRSADLRLVTLAEHYGIPADETISDTTWLELAGTNGWAVFMKDAKIRRQPLERAAVRDHAVRCFCLTRQDLSGAEMAARFLKHLVAITEACAKPGPFLYAIYETRIEELSLD